ncbi:MAG: hypothetical protein SF029_08905 [bacterium]|nr:hypothetical protein [bacterium]
MLTVIYTMGLRGDLDLLPRLYTFLQALRRTHQRDTEDWLLLDLGGSCDPDVWPCGITEGRSTLIVLDAMGYDAANVEGVLSQASRDKLVGQVALALIDSAHPAALKGRYTLVHEAADKANDLTIVVTPNNSLNVEQQILRLPALTRGEIGQVQLAQHPQDGWHIVESATHPIPPETIPDSVISGVVDYVRDEARYYEKRQREPGNTPRNP